MSKESKPTPLPWYKDGLNFQCTECGKCCTGGPGAVWVTPEEIASLADRVGLSIAAFREQYTRKIGSRISLIEKPDSYDCIFLRGKKCAVYENRPKQCRTFPWWPSNLASKKDWDEVECEGINPEAPLVPFEEIDRCLNS
jgi:uncharacterized protein